MRAVFIIENSFGILCLKKSKDFRDKMTLSDKISVSYMLTWRKICREVKYYGKKDS